MLEQISYYMIFGKPLIMYGGISTALLLVVTAILGNMASKGSKTYGIHKAMAAITVIAALGHGILGMLLFF